jgi:putative ABC transport system permease protein
MIENYTGLLSGHIQIHAKGFKENMSLERSIADVGAVRAVIETGAPSAKFSGRIKDYVLISSAENSAGVLLMGVDPEHEKTVSRLYTRIRKGTFLPDDEKIVIGKDLARSLNVGPGDKVVIIGQGYDGSLASAAYRVSGLLDTGAEEIDKGIALITLAAAQELLVLGNRVSEVVVNARSHEEVNALARTLKGGIDPDRYEVLTWQEISPILMQWVEFDVAFINVILLVVVLIVAAGILNTLLMGILERVREFGIMLALGTRRRQILIMIGMESLILGSIGIFFGYLFGAGLSHHFGTRGIDLTAFSTALNDYYAGSIICTRLSPGYMVYYGIIVLVTSLIVSVYPAWRAASLKPVDAIRHM